MPEPLTTQLVMDELRKLQAAFPQNQGMRSNPSGTAEVYRNGLRGLSGDAVRHAADRAIQECQFFPKVAQLREYASAWQRHRASPSMALTRDWRRCGICGAEAKPREIVRRVRDTNDPTFPVKLGEDGKALWETVESASLYVDHDPRAHHVFEDDANA